MVWDLVLRTIPQNKLSLCDKDRPGGTQHREVTGTGKLKAFRVVCSEGGQRRSGNGGLAATCTQRDGWVEISGANMTRISRYEVVYEFQATRSPRTTTTNVAGRKTPSFASLSEQSTDGQGTVDVCPYTYIRTTCFHCASPLQGLEGGYQGERSPGERRLEALT